MPTRISLRRVGASMGKLMAVPDSLAHGRTRFVGGPGFRSIGCVCAAVPTNQPLTTPSASQTPPTDQPPGGSAHLGVPTW